MTTDAYQTTLDEHLALVATNPHPLKLNDRLAILSAIREVATAGGDLPIVSPNAVRARLAALHGRTRDRRLVIDPRILSATYSRLRTLGVLEVVCEIRSDDVDGGNRGKTLRAYRLADPAALDRLIGEAS